MLAGLMFPDSAEAESAFQNLMARARDLWARKQAMEGTKSETRDLLGEVLFSRLRHGFRGFYQSTDFKTEIDAAESVLGALFAGSALNEFANALDRAMLEAARPKDFSFAGRADFISVEEVLQLLSSGACTGMLGIEKDDNRVDVYIQDGKVLFFDPHKLIRRVMPGASSMTYREIPEDLLRQAEDMQAKTGTPQLLSLVELGFLDIEEVPDLLQLTGLEVFYEFLSEQGVCSFFFKKLDLMAPHIEQYGYEMPVTPILLEGSKWIDDWAALLKVFPEPDSVIVPGENMLAQIGSMDLGVLEIKLLAMINGDTSPRQLAPAIGLPLFEVYQFLVRFARAGVIVAEGGEKELHEVSFSLDESMEKAFAALDANDDERSRESALENAFGDPFQETTDPFEPESFLDILTKTDFRKPASE